MTFLKLKPLTVEHLSAAVNLDELCFGGLWTRSGYERELDSPNSQLLVLEAASGNGESSVLQGVSEDITQNSVTTDVETALIPERSLIALGCYWAILEEAHITILAVHPEYQRQGLGKLLLYALLWDARRCLLEWATLEVKPSNQAALSLYQKFGFTEVGRRRRYYKDTGEDAIILWRSGLQTLEFKETLANCYREVERSFAHQGWQLSNSWREDLITSKPFHQPPKG